jgi:hypothetical protein
MRIFSSAVRGAAGTNQPLGFEALASGIGEGAYLRTEAFVAAELLQRIGPSSPQGASLLDWLARQSTSVSPRGAADRVVLGRFFENGKGWGYTQEASANGGITFQVPDGVWNQLPRPIQEALNVEFIRQQMRAGVGRFDVVGGDIGDILRERPGSFTAVELGVLATEGPALGYTMDAKSKSWILVEP